MRWVEKAIALVSRVFTNVGMVFLSFLMLIITADVFLRLFFNNPIRGSNELAEFIMLPVIFLAMAYTQYMKGNISVNILYERFPVGAQRIIDIFVNLLCLGICSLLLWQAIAYFNYLSGINRESLILKLPVAPFETIMIIGFFMLFLVLIFDIYHSVRKVVSK
jgi:TRAP-type C4-dicarboxylate transport system permease small subunit